MVIRAFPSVESADPDGLLAVGGDLEIDSLKLAYANGIFPWPTQGFPLLWFAPPRRAILEFKDLSISKRLQREIQHKHFHFKLNTNFQRVLSACAEGATRSEQGTWITPSMIQAYIAFYHAGYGHSFECYNQQDQLVGGLYGVRLNKFFAGESMFFWETGASKAVLIYTCQKLKEMGLSWMDVQIHTDFLARFGVKEISRGAYMEKLQKTLMV